MVCGAKLKRSIVPNSAAIYNFQRAFRLDQEEVSQAQTKAELPLPSACLLGHQHSPCIRHKPLLGHGRLQPANGELGVIRDPRVETGGRIWDQ